MKTLPVLTVLQFLVLQFLDNQSKLVASYQTQQYGSIGRSYDVRLYYRNTGNTDATGVTAGIVPSSTGNSLVFKFICWWC